MKTYIYKGRKYTPSILKKLHIIFIGTGAECETYAEELDKKHGTDLAFVGSFGDWEYHNTRKGIFFECKGWAGHYDDNACFVRYFGSCEG